MKYLRLFVVLVSLLTCFIKAKADDYEFVNYQIEKNGVIYSLYGDYSDGVDGKNTTYAVVSGFSDDFEGTTFIIEESLQVEMKKCSDGDKIILINIPVKYFYFNDSFAQVISLTLPKTITGELSLYNLNNLEEVNVDEGNEEYSSNQGLLCNATGESLIYIPEKSSQIVDGVLTVPLGIHYDTSYHEGISVRYQDRLYAWPSYISGEMWLEKNLTPPEGNLNGNIYILHVPTGCLDAYSEVYAYYILEEGTNVDRINNNPLGTAFYDVDNDGDIEILKADETIIASKNDGTIVFTDLGDSNNNIYKGAYFNVYQNPGRDKLTYVSEGNDLIYVDVNSDGLKDYVKSGYGVINTSPWSIKQQQPDGTFIETEQVLIDKDENESTAGRLPSLRDGMFLGDTGPTTLKSINMATDVNSDGILDLMDTENGGILYSSGDNQWLKYSTKTIVWPCDIDNDGQEDFVIYDGTTVSLITNRNSSSPTKTELFKSTLIQNVLFKDFDKDGDIDIMLNYVSGYTYTYDSGSLKFSYTIYFVFLRNNGNGTFRKKESNLVETISSSIYNFSLVSCGDYDNDGLYELVVNTSYYYSDDYGSNPKGRLLKVHSDFSVSESPEVLSPGGSYCKSLFTDLMIGDFDNNGYTEWYAKKGLLYGHLNSQTTRNTAPQKMAKPTAVLQPETGWLKISWQRGQDKETSACDLTYELRIGTEPGKGDVLCAASLEDGRRRTLREGEMGTSLYKLFNANTLKPGKYYIAVQAIDAGGLGGAFSDEFVYELHPSNPSFTFDIQMPSTADIVQTRIKAPTPEATYEWVLSEGEVLAQDSEGAKLQFHRMGSHTISLNMTHNGVVYKSEPQNIYVDAAKAKGSSQHGGIFVDVNQDGYPEEIGYQNDGQGNISKVPLSLFSESLGGVCFITDYNRDGYPDFVTWGSIKGNLFLNYGEQDFDFDNQTVDTSFPFGDYATDFNNDGRTDVISGHELSYDAGDGLTYNPMAESYSPAIFYDVNRDGFLDILTEHSTNNDGESWTVRYKEKTVDMTYGEEIVLFRLSEDFLDNAHLLNIFDRGSSYFADINNDGYVDLIREGSLSDSTLYIVKGVTNGVGKEAIRVDGVVYAQNSQNGSSEGIECIRDIDNDGILDIVSSKDCIIHMNKEGKFVVERINVNTRIYNGGPWMVTKDGGYPLTYYNMQGSIRNTKPSAPATVAAKQTAEGLLITWADAADDHTPAMQMRYNVSVKRKGKTGPGAYIISPMNGESDVATIVSNYLYKQSTQMLVPASVLTVGETYEIRVQAIDLWNEVSPMTKAIEFTMGGDGYISVPEQVTMNSEVTVKYMGAKMSKYSINVGAGGKVVKNLGNGQYIVTWSSEGVKQISITAGSKTVKSSVTVVKSIDLTLDLPDVIYAGTQTPIRLSDSFAENAGTGSLRICSRKYLGYIDPLTGEEGYVETELDVEYNLESKMAYVTFPKSGKYYFEVTSNDPVRGGSNKFEIEVTSVMPEAKIARVDIDGQTNRYAINWDTSSLPADIVKVVILKEGKSLNQFNALDTVAIGKGRYVDMSSNPAVMSARYQIKLVSSNGQVSEPSVAHRPLHVMLTTAPGGYNLIWDRYEGIEVDNYKIFRGSSPDNLTLLKQVAGSLRSYTDKKPANGVNYYSIVFTPVNAASRAEVRRTIPNGDISSNVMSSENAIDAILAESIEILMADENAKLCKDTPELQLYSILKPAYCTINEVEWNIVEGEDLATIDDDGILKIANGDCSGTVVVQARTIDGSNLSTSQSVIVEAMSASVGDANGDGKVDANDIEDIVNHTMGKPTSTGKFSETNADANEDGIVNIADIVKIVNIIMRGGDNN